MPLILWPHLPFAQRPSLSKLLLIPQVVAQLCPLTNTGSFRLSFLHATTVMIHFFNFGIINL